MLKFNTRSSLWLGNKDHICTMHGMFTIRDNQLNLSMVMRSSDLYLGLVFDLPFFGMLQMMMLSELSSHYPDIELGTYRHLSHSLHIYDRNQESVLKMLGRK